MLTSRAYPSASTGYSPNFKEIPKTQVPHTLLTKPVAEGRLFNARYRRHTITINGLPIRHKGVDFIAPEGTAVLAAGDGVIEKLDVNKRYGDYLRIQHANKFLTVYAQLKEIMPDLAVGVRVVKGQVIGTVGKSGAAISPHLHYELIISGKSVSPFFE